MKNLIIRALTGIVYVAALVGCTVWSPLSCGGFFVLVAIGCMWEFCTLMTKHYDAQLNPSMSGLAAIILCCAMWELQVQQIGDARKLFMIYGFCLLYLLITELYKRADHPLKNWALSFAAQLYVAVPFALIPLLCVSYDFVENRLVYQWIYPLAIFIFLWTSDTGAYLVGSTFGKYVPYKLFPRISPNKSWIGSIGGGLLTLVAAAIVSYFANGQTFETATSGMGLYQWLGLGLVVCVFGTWGDLVESLIKRELGIKDSGKILPGHGGLLDRFDSALLAIPAAVIYCSYFCL